MGIDGIMADGRSAARAASLRAIVPALVFALAGAVPASAQSTSDGDETTLREEIIVTGHRASAASAQAIKKNAIQVIDSIVAEDVGKLPDNNVADALARVTGIQIRRDSGEGNSVLIRGLPNIVTLLNGREVFTTTSRFIALADIPANMLERVDVYKTNGASLIEGGIAGTIDVRTRGPFSAPGLRVFGTARGVYSDKSEATDPDIGLTVSNTWDTGAGEFGALLGLSYQRRNYHEERAFNVAPEPQTCTPDPPPGEPECSTTRGQFNPANPAPVDDFKGPFVVGQIPIAGDRQRIAGNFTLEWRPNERTRLYADGFVTDYEDKFELDFFVGLPFLGNGDISATVFPGTNQMRTLTNHDVFTITSTQANDNDSVTRQFALGGSYEAGNFTFSTDIARTTSRFDLVNPIMDVATIVPEVFVDTNHEGTVLLRYGGDGYDIRDGSTYDIVNWFDNHGFDEGRSVDWRGDVVWLPSSDGVLTSISAGLRYANRKAESIRSFEGAAYPFLATPTSSLPGLDGLSEPMASGGPRYDLVQWYTPSADYLLDNIDLVRQQTAGMYFQDQTSAELFAFRNDPETFARKLDPGTFFSDEEITTALYVEAEFDGEMGRMPWAAALGIRVARTEQTLGGNLSQDLTGDGILTYTSVESSNDSTDVLPSASFKLFLTQDVIARTALSRTLTRPNFPDLNPGVSLSTIVSNTTGLTGSGGNPNLKPVESDNLDLALEWYFADAGSLTVTAFGRKFDGYVQPTFEDQTFAGNVYRISRPGNTGSGRLTGVEVAYQQFYDRLPGPLAGLGLQLNVTYMDGETEDVDTGEDRTITGVSDLAYNIIGLYELERWSGRLAYNWRSDFVDAYAFAANPSGVYDIYVDDTAQMDGSLSFHVNDNFTLTFEAVNILDTEFTDYFNDKNLYPRDTRRYDRTYEFGFRANF
jgi:TonB-dependent receptor